MYEIKKFEIMSVVKIETIISAILGFLLGIFYTILGLALPSEMGVAGIMFSPWSILILPIVYGIFGFIAGIIFTWLYNLIASKTGGIKVEMKQHKK